MQYDQTIAQIDASKPLELGFAKPANLAFGVEYRKEHYEIGRGDVASYVFGGIAGKAAGRQGFPGFKPSNEVSKDRSSSALYVELDSQVTEKFGVDAAVRYENFSDFGSTTTGKVSARYDFAEGLALRGTVATGFRAPALQQQYFTRNFDQLHHHCGREHAGGSWHLPGDQRHRQGPWRQAAGA